MRIWFPAPSSVTNEAEAIAYNAVWNNAPSRPGLTGTDIERWSDPARYDPGWAWRAKLAADLTPQAGWLCDIGCGPHQFMRSIRPDAVYLPADLVAWTPDTEVCDLNAGRPPYRALALCDVVFLLGVVEYLSDPAAVFMSLHGVERFVLTYNPTEVVPHGRDSGGWLSALSIDQMVAAVKAAGFDIEWMTPRADLPAKVFFMVAINRNFGWFDRVRRALRRSLSASSRRIEP